LDGGGYPDGLSGDEFPLLAQIVAIVDVFDALTTDRPYRPAIPTETAYSIMLADAEAGWCPRKLVSTFVQLHRNRSWQAFLRKGTLGMEPGRLLALR
jgi:putative two-component system response regulator